MSKRKNKGFLNSIEREILVMLVFDWGYSVICVINDICVLNDICVINGVCVIIVINVPKWL